MAKHKQKRVNKQNREELYQNCPRANFIIRMGAYFIDFIAVSILLMIATVFAIFITMVGNKTGLIDLSAYNSTADYLAHNLIFAGFLAVVSVAFYGYFWNKSGQTIGMKVCRLRVQNSDGSNISFTQSLIRMATSAFGLGNLFAITPNHNAFQDLWAECEVIVLTKELNSRKGFIDDKDKNNLLS